MCLDLHTRRMHPLIDYLFIWCVWMFSVILIIFCSFWVFSKMQSSCESYPAKLKLPLLPRIKIYSPQKALVWDIEGQWWLITSYQTLSQSDSGFSWKDRAARFLTAFQCAVACLKCMSSAASHDNTGTTKLCFILTFKCRKYRKPMVSVVLSWWGLRQLSYIFLPQEPGPSMVMDGSFELQFAILL